MTPEQKQQLQEYVREIAKLLYADAESQGMPMGNLAQVEQTVRQQMLSHVSPEIGVFLSTLAQTQPLDIAGP